MRVGTEKSMNNTKKLRSALLSSLTIIASIVLGHTAQAAVLLFEPAGGDFSDGDNIRDIKVQHPNLDIVVFEIELLTQGLADSVKFFEYKVEFDSKELQFDDIAGVVIDRKDFKDKDNISSFTVFNKNATTAIPENNLKKITYIRFKAIGELPSDGEFDFKISKAGGRYHNGGNIDVDEKVFKYGIGDAKDVVSQQVEVQEGRVPGTPEPTSILGLFSLGIIGAGATIKRQVKRNHSIEKETTEIG